MYEPIASISRAVPMPIRRRRKKLKTPSVQISDALAPLFSLFFKDIIKRALAFLAERDNPAAAIALDPTQLFKLCQ